MIPKPEFRAVRPARILLLEDEPDSVELVRRYLTRSGATISLDCATTLAEALAKLRTSDFDLVLCDLNLPDSSGLDTLDSVAGSTDRLIIVLTGSDEPELAEPAVARGAYDLLYKKHLNAGNLARVVRLAAMQSSSFRSLRESETRFRGLTELSSDWYWEQDAELRFVATGGSSDARGGITPAAHIGKQRWELPGTDVVNQ